MCSTGTAVLSDPIIVRNGIKQNTDSDPLKEVSNPLGFGSATPSGTLYDVMLQLGPQNIAMEKLLSVESDYWSTFIEVEEGDRLYPRLDT